MDSRNQAVHLFGAELCMYVENSSPLKLKEVLLYSVSRSLHRFRQRLLIFFPPAIKLITKDGDGFIQHLANCLLMLCFASVLFPEVQ